MWHFCLFFFNKNQLFVINCKILCQKPKKLKTLNMQAINNKNQENEIIQKIIEGNENAFKLLVDQYQNMVLNICNSFLHNYDDSMDVAQEVFIKVYQNINKFRRDSSIKTWLYRIAVNKSLNFIRNKKKNTIFSSLDILFETEDNKKKKNIEAIDTEKTSDEKIIDDDNKSILLKAINTLPKKQKSVIVLNNYENLAYKEIAEIMEISISEVGVLINRAKKKLYKKIIHHF